MTHIDESLDAIVTAVDVTAQLQMATTHQGAGRACDLSLESLEVAEFWMQRARQLDTTHDPPPIYDEQETGT